MKIHVLYKGQWGNTLTYMNPLKDQDGYRVLGFSKISPVEDGDFVVLIMGEDAHVFRADKIEMKGNPADMFEGNLIRPGEGALTEEDLKALEEAVNGETEDA